jgi:hypothetical protein
MRRLVTTTALVLFSLSLAGCGPIGGAAALVLGLAMALLVGCAESHSLRPDGEVLTDAAGDGDAGRDAGGGSWERCCEGGRLATCHCPAGWACNYGMGLVDCGGGACTYATMWPVDVELACGRAPDGGDVDAGVDAGGAWEPCCDESTHMLSTCFCPGGAECNFGWYSTCPDGSCTLGACPEDVDAGPPDDPGSPDGG